MSSLSQGACTARRAEPGRTGVPPPGDGDGRASSPRGHRAPADGWRGWRGPDPEQGWGPAAGAAEGEKQGEPEGRGEGSGSPTGERVPGSSVDLWWEKGLGVRGREKEREGGGQANTHVHRLIPNENQNQPKPNS